MSQHVSINLGEVTLTAPSNLVAQAVIGLATGTQPPIQRDAAHAPRLGQPWPEQGGIYVGTVRGEDGRPDYHLIVGAGDGADFCDVKWGEYGKDIPGAKHDRDGMANTIAMADAGSDLARKILDLQHNGHNDWYLPSRQELALCWMNTDDVFAKVWHWSSSQSSAYYAFPQTFDDGHQSNAGKNGSFRARAVRRFVIQ